MSSVSSLTPFFSNLQLQLARYVYCPLYATGNIGHILNLIVFSQKKLRTASICSCYFLSLSIANLISINTGYLTRILTYMGFPDPSRTVGWYCTGRVYISAFSLTLGRYFICSIVIDRFLMTSISIKLRRLRSFKVVKWYISLSVLCWMIFYVHIWFGYSGYQNGTACKRREGVYTIFVTVYSFIIDVSLPIIVMIIFSLLTLNNIYGLYQQRNRIFPAIQAIEMKITAKNAINNRSICTLPSDQSNKREKKRIDK
jgi:hypothetical protein